MNALDQALRAHTVPQPTMQVPDAKAVVATAEIYYAFLAQTTVMGGEQRPAAGVDFAPVDV